MLHAPQAILEPLNVLGAIFTCKPDSPQNLDDGRSPLGRIPLLFHLREDAFRLIVVAVRASRELSIALDLLLPAHVACLAASGQHVCRPTSSSEHSGNPSDSPSQSSASLPRLCPPTIHGPQTFARRSGQAVIGAFGAHVRCSFRISGGAGS